MGGSGSRELHNFVVHERIKQDKIKSPQKSLLKKQKQNKTIQKGIAKERSILSHCSLEGGAIHDPASHSECLCFYVVIILRFDKMDIYVKNFNIM